MSRELAANVTVGAETYLKGTVPPDDVADLIANPKAWVVNPSSRSSEKSTSSGGDGLFDPSAEGVDEVNNHLAGADPDEVARVLAAEKAGKARKGVLEGPYAPEE